MSILIFKSKESILEYAQETMLREKYLSTLKEAKDKTQFYSLWADGLTLMFVAYAEKRNYIKNKFNEKKNSLKRTFISFFLFCLATYFFLYDNEVLLDASFTVFMYIAPIFFILHLLRLFSLKLRVINESTIILKELSLATAISFDHFFEVDLVKEKYKELNGGAVFDLTFIRTYLAKTLSSITHEFIVDTTLSYSLRSDVLRNIIIYQQKLIEQNNSCVNLDSNYKEIFNHIQQNFN